MTYYKTTITYMNHAFHSEYFCIPKGELKEREKYLIKLNGCIDNYDKFVPKYSDVGTFKTAFHRFVDACRLKVEEVSGREYAKAVITEGEL